VLDKYPNKVKFVMKHFPLKSHKYARKAAKAALAADQQGKFWAFHDMLFENHKAINDAKIQDIAKELSLDMEEFAIDMKSSAIQSLINREVKNGRQAGVRGTPTVFINGKKLKKRNLRGFIQRIETELRKKK